MGDFDTCGIALANVDPTLTKKLLNLSAIFFTIFNIFPSF